jgi:metallo-beta-lactamase family protein
VRFLGAAETVTGSRFLVSGPHGQVLVDCGLFQGLKALRLRNWDPLPVAAEAIDAVVLTHAHVDHCGYLPALVRAGFAGPVFATAATRELAAIVLPDSGRLQEEDADYANRRGFSKHEPALPLFTESDARAALALFRSVGFGEPVEVAPGMRATLDHAGHILGAASVHLALDGEAPRRIGVSGDLGRAAHPILRGPDPPRPADAWLVESTYGDRRHQDEDHLLRLADAIVRTAERGGVVVIPAFAVDRTEIVLLQLRRLVEDGRIPALPIHVDSPMALAALGVYHRAVAEGWEEVRAELHGQKAPFDAGTLREVRQVAESRDLQRREGPFIVVSASGMATGGRVLHHLRARLPDPRASVLLVGYQPEGTRGRRLLAGESAIKMHGQYVPVRAEVVDLSGFSAHADAGELVAWLAAAAEPPGVVYAVHGELASARALAARVRDELGLTSVVPRHGERVRI